MTKTTVRCIDAHTCGNSVLVVIEGAPALAGSTVANKRVEFMANHDWVRRSLMREP